MDVCLPKLYAQMPHPTYKHISLLGLIVDEGMMVGQGNSPDDGDLGFTCHGFLAARRTASC